MSRRMERYYVDNNVYEEAKKRIREIINLHDHVVCQFSGGKDSQTALHLVKEVYDEDGIDQPVKVVFRDPEFCDKYIIEQVDMYRQYDWVDMTWVCVPSKRQFISCGISNKVISWDPERAKRGLLTREIPEWAYTDSPLTNEDAQQSVTREIGDHILSDLFSGRVAAVTGIRAAESIIRFASSTQRTQHNYLTDSNNPAVTLARPIYDWADKDVYKYIYDNKLPYAKAYDIAQMNGMAMRAGGHLTGMASYENLQYIQVIDPEMYDKMLEVFPMARLQTEYGADFDYEGQVKKWGKSFARVRTWIDLYVPEDLRPKAIHIFEETMTPALKSPSTYTPEVFMRRFLKGEFGSIPPMKDRRSKKEQ